MSAYRFCRTTSGCSSTRWIAAGLRTLPTSLPWRRPRSSGRSATSKCGAVEREPDREIVALRSL